MCNDYVAVPRHAIFQATNLFDKVYDSAYGIAALADLLKVADTERLEDYTVNHIGNLLDEVACSLFQTAESGCKLVKLEQEAIS